MKVGSGDDKRWVVSASHGFPTQPISPCSGAPILHGQLRLLLGRRVRRDGLGSAGFMVDIISKVFSSLKWFCDSLAVPCPGSGLAAPDTHFPKQELSHSACGGSAPRGLPLVGFGTGTL